MAENENSNEELIVYLTMPFLHKGNTYPILPEGYKLKHLPKAVLDFPHKKVVGSDRKLKEFIAEESRNQKRKDRDFRAETAIADVENEKLKQQVEQLTEKNQGLESQIGEILKTVKAMQKSQSTPAEKKTETKAETKTARTDKK